MASLSPKILLDLHRIVVAATDAAAEQANVRAIDMNRDRARRAGIDHLMNVAWRREGGDRSNRVTARADSLQIASIGSFNPAILDLFLLPLMDSHDTPADMVEVWRASPSTPPLLHSLVWQRRRTRLQKSFSEGAPAGRLL